MRGETKQEDEREIKKRWRSQLLNPDGPLHQVEYLHNYFLLLLLLLLGPVESEATLEAINKSQRSVASILAKLARI